MHILHRCAGQGIPWVAEGIKSQAAAQVCRVCGPVTWLPKGLMFPHVRALAQACIGSGAHQPHPHLG